MHSLLEDIHKSTCVDFLKGLPGWNDTIFANSEG